MNTTTFNSLEAVYDQYSGAIYGILLKLCPNHEDVNAMLLQIFREFSAQEFAGMKPATIFSTLLKLSFKTALQSYQQGRQFAMGNMHQCPALYRILFEQVCMEACSAKPSSPGRSNAQLIQQELGTLRLQSRRNQAVYS